MSDGKVTIDTTLNSSGVDKGLSETSAKMKASFSGMSKSIISLGTLIKATLGVALVKGLKALVTTGVQYNAEMEKYQTALTTVLGSSKEAQKVMSQIQKDALSTPFDVSSLVQANQFLISAGESAEDSRKTILALSDAVSATGGGNDELQRMAQNLQQVRNNGKATAIDIKQFGYAGINIYQLLADYTGKSVQEVQNMEVSYDLLSKALQHASEEGGRFYQANKKQSETLNGVYSNFKESIQVFAGTLTKGLGESLKGAMKNVTGIMNQLSTAFNEGGFGNMAKVGIDIVNQMLIGVTSQAPQLTKKAGDMLKSFINGVKANVPSLIQNGINAVSSFITGIAQQMPELVPMALDMLLTLAQSIVNNLPTLINAGINMIKGLITGLINSIPLLIQKVPQLINTFANAIQVGAFKLITTGIQLIAKLVVGLIKAIPTLIANAGQILMALINVFSLSKMIKLGGQLMKALGNGLKSLGGWLATTLKSLGTKAWNNFKNINWIGAGKSALKAVINGIKGLGSTLWSSVKSLAKTAVTKFKEVDWLQLGKDVVNGIIKGIGSMASGLFDKLKNLAKDALGIAKDEIDSHSPSRKFRDEVGIPIVQGIMVGIDKLKKPLNKEIRGLVNIPDVNVQSNVARVIDNGNLSKSTLSSVLSLQTNSSPQVVIVDNNNENQTLSIKYEGREIGRMVGKFTNGNLKGQVRTT